VARRSKGVGNMTVSEAGKKGGEATKSRSGPGFYERIGKIGGNRVKELIEAGKKLELIHKCFCTQFYCLGSKHITKAFL
jgi:uncharacterized protein